MQLTPAQKAVLTRSRRHAALLAFSRGRNAKTFAKYELTKRGYRHVSFESRRGYEYKGIVDLLAVRRSKGNPDSLEVMLLQVKGGSARVTPVELGRLRKAADMLHVSWNVVHKPNRSVRFMKKIH
jgi:hypothetical protein